MNTLLYSCLHYWKGFRELRVAVGKAFERMGQVVDLNRRNIIMTAVKLPTPKIRER